MHTPFIDTRCHHALRLACNVSTYPHKFCLSEPNRILITSLTDQCLGVQTLVERLYPMQAMLAQKLPLTGTTTLWKSREVWLQQTQIQTTLDTAPLPDGTLTDVARLYDLQLLEPCCRQCHATPRVPHPHKTLSAWRATASGFQNYWPWSSWASPGQPLTRLAIAPSRRHRTPCARTFAGYGLVQPWNRHLLRPPRWPSKALPSWLPTRLDETNCKMPGYRH